MIGLARAKNTMYSWTRTRLWLSQSEPLLEYLDTDLETFQCVCILHENCAPIPVWIVGGI